MFHFSTNWEYSVCTRPSGHLWHFRRKSLSLSTLLVLQLVYLISKVVESFYETSPVFLETGRLRSIYRDENIIINWRLTQPAGYTIFC